jgi:hypothetical protein
MIIIPTNNLIFVLLKVKNDVFLNIEKKFKHFHLAELYFLSFVANLHLLYSFI